jgi:hypothetical protein
MTSVALYNHSVRANDWQAVNPNESAFGKHFSPKSVPAKSLQNQNRTAFGIVLIGQRTLLRACLPNAPLVTLLYSSGVLSWQSGT